MTVTATDENDRKGKRKDGNSDLGVGNDKCSQDGIQFKYKTGIAALRSSAHRVKYSLDHRRHDPKPVGKDGEVTNVTFLPLELCAEDVISYSTSDFDFHGTVVDMLRRCDKDLIGTFRIPPSSSSGLTVGDGTFSPSLEDFVVPVKSLTRKCQKGSLERAQKTLSNEVACDAAFLELFDRFVIEFVLPHLKNRLKSAGVVATAEKGEQKVNFYYQRPPTMRIQPGPARALVRAHNDGEYGHQNGELNFWLPLSSSNTGVDIFCESSNGVGDYHPLKAEYGNVVAFHGTSCKHYVNANRSSNTRVSLDFRVGIEGFFDPYWEMNGTTDDHSRRKVSL